MMRDVKKEWCCLIYANGHNELAPETYDMINELINCQINDSVHIVIQMAFESQEVINLIRGNKCPNSMTQYCGRYYIKHNELCLEEELEPLNMADPKSLEEFIIWGSSHYPANKYLLLMGGHVYQFVGLSPDYSQNAPYLLSFCDLATAINHACSISEIEIELLVLDTCYCSTIEILTEICNEENHVVKHLLTYFGSGPLHGMPYEKIISMMTEPNQKTINGLQKVIKLNQSEPAYQLVGVILDELMISLYKKVFNMIAIAYYSWREQTKQQLLPYEVLACQQSDFPWKKLIILNEQISMKILIKNNDQPMIFLPIHVLYDFIPDDIRRSLYSRFRFAKNNKWFYLLCQFDVTQSNPYQSEFFSYEPVIIPRELLKMFINSTNYHNDDETNEVIVQNLIELKKWEF